MPPKWWDGEHILRRSTWKCLIIKLSIRAVVGFSVKGYFCIQIDVPVGNLIPKITQNVTLHQILGNQEIFQNNRKTHF